MTNRWGKSMLVFLGVLGATYVEAQTPRTLEVYGEGQIEVVPDMAHVQVGVTTVGEHVEKASAENARAVEAVLSAVEATGVERSDMTTSNFSIGMERNYREEKDRAVYRVNNMVDITVHDLSIIGQVLGAAMSGGANEVRGLRLEVAQKRAAMVRARALAAEDARQKAEHLASLHGVEIGPVLSITEGGGGGSAPLLKTMAMDARSVPISAGSQRLSATIRVVYQLK